MLNLLTSRSVLKGHRVYFKNLAEEKSSQEYISFGVLQNIFMGFMVTSVYYYIIASYDCNVKMTSRNTPPAYNADSVS